MDAGTVIGLVLGSTVISGLISSAFTRKSAKESNGIDLLDRAYKEIERLDDRLAERDRQLKEAEEELEALKQKLGGIT